MYPFLRKKYIGMYFLDIASFRLWYANPLTGFWRKNDIEFMIFSWNVCNVIFKCTWEKKKKDLQVDPLSISFLICWNVFSWKKRKTKRWGLYESRRRACNCLTARRRRNKRSSPARDRFRERIRFSSVIRLEESRAKSFSFLNIPTNSLTISVMFSKFRITFS